MSVDAAVALSLLEAVPRLGLTARLRARDPELLDLAARELPAVRAALERARAAGIEAVSWDDPRFPEALRPLEDCPPVLWCRGDPAAFTAPAVAIVGSRAASASALEMATLLGRDLAALGVAVVSGLARGVDSAAHRGALETGRTVAVLGSGLGRIYPHEHRGLADAIATAGCVVSEYPPDTPPLAFHFPARNRLISGLSRIVVVIEASERSGSLITAARALEQGREVMAVPGNVLSGRNAGGHALIRDGARIVESAGDVVDELRSLPGWTLPPAAPRGVPADGVVPAWFEPGRAYDLDELVAASGLPAPRLLAQLSEWEIRTWVRRTASGRFVRVSRPC